MASDESERQKLSELIDAASAVVAESRPLLNAIRQFPGLAWVKRYQPRTSRYVMVEMSAQYALRILGGKREEYIGKTDFDVWDYDTAVFFFENDEDTRLGRRNPTTQVHEPWESSRTGQKGTFIGWKWRFEAEGVEYVAGIGQG